MILSNCIPLNPSLTLLAHSFHNAENKHAGNSPTCTLVWRATKKTKNRGMTKFVIMIELTSSPCRLNGDVRRGPSYLEALNNRGAAVLPLGLILVFVFMQSINTN